MRRWLVWTIVFCAVLVGVAEWCLARRDYFVDDPNGCKEYEMFDPYLGWKPLVGRNLSPEARNGVEIYENVWPDTSRVSRPQRDKVASKRVLLLGCSYTYGTGVSDRDTFAWKLNARFPDIAFDNFAMFAYGTYQCYLREKEQFLLHPDDYDLVLYCTYLDHLARNLDWASKVGDVRYSKYYAMVPRVDIDSKGELCFFDPLRHWFGDTLLRSINFAKRTYYCRLVDLNALHRAEPTPARSAAFWELNLRMAEEAKKHGAKYGLVWLNGMNTWNFMMNETEKLYTNNPWGNPKYNKERYAGINWICTGIGTEEDVPENHVNNDPTCHYNSKVHSYWAQKIGDWVEELLEKENMTGQ